MTEKINIYVSGGNLSYPHYEFYFDSKGENKLSSLVLDANKEYIFYKLNNLYSHPFYLTDTEIGEQTSSSIKLILSYTSLNSPSGMEVNTIVPLEVKPDLLSFLSSKNIMEADNIMMQESKCLI